jgi:16S rRNA (guanine(966)-N(2))-methyltransferase RsmD
MRVIGGTYRGRTLITVRDLSIRPTTDRAKQTIFDMLATRCDLDGARVLDLFSGSGSLGLEAISRGAASVTFVERARTSVDVLEKNIRALDCAAHCTVHTADVFWFLKNVAQPYDVVFADPPYKLPEIGMLPVRIHESAAVRNGTWVVMEHSRESAMQFPDNGYTVITKPFGQTTVLIMHAIKPSASE